MGQYSQWLHHREIDRQLRSMRDKLEEDLHKLQEQAQNLEVHDFRAPNRIIQALQQYMHSDAQPSALSTDAPARHLSSVPEHSTSTAIPVVRPRPQRAPFPGTIYRHGYISPAIPRHTPPLKAAQLTPITPTVTALQLASNRQVIPAQDPPPQEALQYTGHTRSHNRTLPVDQQSEQTDQMVQRWFERWSKGRQNIQDTQDE